MHPISNKLIQWYKINKRDLPWRNTTDPYKIWLSEIMLQQTRVAQGMPYFHAFTTAFPTVFDLANASEQEDAVAVFYTQLFFSYLNYE